MRNYKSLKSNNYLYISKVGSGLYIEASPDFICLKVDVIPGQSITSISDKKHQVWVLTRRKSGVIEMAGRPKDIMQELCYVCRHGPRQPIRRHDRKMSGSCGAFGKSYPSKSKGGGAPPPKQKVSVSSSTSCKTTVVHEAKGMKKPASPCKMTMPPKPKTSAPPPKQKTTVQKKVITTKVTTVTTKTVTHKK